MGCDSQIPIVPVTGFLDTRSLPDQVPYGGYRRALNVEVTTKQRLCRARGWAKRGYSEAEFNNQDLHDQLSGSAQHVILLHEAITTAGFTHLYAATQNRIYASISGSGNWNLISDELGPQANTDCPDICWSAGSVGQITVFSNNIDKPVFHVAGQPPLVGDQAVAVIKDLERLKVSKAGLVVSWNGLLLLMDVEQDGTRHRGRIIWSDYNRPLSLWPNNGISLAGSSDLPNGEIILSAKAMADRLLIYTTVGIREAIISGGTAVLSFPQRYVSETGSRCLAYKRTLVSTGDTHYYMGKDGIYKYSLYDPQPELVDYIHRASATIFDDINSTACNAHCAGFNSERKQVWFSWARRGEACPSDTLVIGTEFPFCSLLEEGFSAFVNTEPHINAIIRDVVRTFCICTKQELEEAGLDESNQGGQCNPDPDAPCPVQPTSFWTLNEKSEPELDIVIEDWTQNSPDPGSFGGLYANITIGSICDTEFLAGDCQSNKVFVMASTYDKCLKEAANLFYREHCVSRTGCGLYSQDGYRSIMTSGALAFNAPNVKKQADSFQIEAHPEPATIPGELILRVGSADHAVDPLKDEGRCAIFWDEQDIYRLECQGVLTVAESRKEGSAPMEPFAWGLFLPGLYLYYEIEIRNNYSNPPHTGAAVCFSRYDMMAHKVEGC